MGELNGLSLELDGSTDYLDLSSQAPDFGLSEGTFSVWVKTSSSQVLNPLFRYASEPIVEAFTDPESNETSFTTTPGSFIALELSNGLPRLAGVGADKPGNRVNDGEWHHIVASFPFVQIWVDGEIVSTNTYDLDDLLYQGTDNLFSFSAIADQLNIGRAMDRVFRSTPIFYSGRMDDFIIYDRTLTDEEVKYLFNLRRGREQIPRLEALVDAVGTVSINNQGEGYRENPELVFWYGEEQNSTDLTTFENLEALEGHFTENNGTHGLMVYVSEEDAVYSFHEGNSSGREYSWRYGASNGWRVLIEATGIGEFEDASVGEVVWAKKMDTVTELPMPDGRLVDRLIIDYVTMDENLSSPLNINTLDEWPHPYYKPQGLLVSMRK